MKSMFIGGVSGSLPEALPSIQTATQIGLGLIGEVNNSTPSQGWMRVDQVLQLIAHFGLFGRRQGGDEAHRQEPVHDDFLGGS